MNARDIEKLQRDVVADTKLSSTSKRALENRVITYELSLINNRLNNKLDKVEGKGLSTNDFTNEYKQIIEQMDTIKILFEGESVGDISLTMAKSKFIDIVYGIDTYNTIRIYEPVGKTIALVLDSCNNMEYIKRTQVYKINVDSLMVLYKNKLIIDSDGILKMVKNDDITDDDKIRIFKIISHE